MLRTVPLLIMFVLTIFLALGLFNSEVIDSINRASTGKKFDNFEISSLASDKKFTPKIFEKNRRVTVVNVFASWCKPCALEHDNIMKLAKEVYVYGIAWKDRPEDTFNYLKKNGNPFQLIGTDINGKTTVPMFLTGVPETFVLDGSGRIVLHYKSVITDEVLNDVMLPLIRKLQDKK
ncbi:MAG: hypothetical protein R3D71_04640 [Rickettsiales bacterium]